MAGAQPAMLQGSWVMVWGFVSRLQSSFLTSFHLECSLTLLLLVRGFDVRVHADLNIHTGDGLFRLGSELARCRPGKTLVLIEPTCASWVPCSHCLLAFTTCLSSSCVLSPPFSSVFRYGLPVARHADPRSRG